MLAGRRNLFSAARSLGYGISRGLFRWGWFLGFEDGFWSRMIVRMLGRDLDARIVRVKRLKGPLRVEIRMRTRTRETRVRKRRRKTMLWGGRRGRWRF